MSGSLWSLPQSTLNLGNLFSSEYPRPREKYTQPFEVLVKNWDPFARICAQLRHVEAFEIHTIDAGSGS